MFGLREALLGIWNCESLRTWADFAERKNKENVSISPKPTKDRMTRGKHVDDYQKSQALF